jgi:hypothetical protein
VPHEVRESLRPNVPQELGCCASVCTSTRGESKKEAGTWIQGSSYARKMAVSGALWLAVKGNMYWMAACFALTR